MTDTRYNLPIVDTGGSEELEIISTVLFRAESKQENAQRFVFVPQSQMQKSLIKARLPRRTLIKFILDQAFTTFFILLRQYYQIFSNWYFLLPKCSIWFFLFRCNIRSLGSALKGFVRIIFCLGWSQKNIKC